MGKCSGPKIMDSISTIASTTPDLSSIQNFYSNTNIFITGASGFYGKILIEKLLRSCPTICKIYILIRDKRGIDSKTRLTHLFDEVVFERLKQECPHFRSKVVEIHGDLLLPGLGISSENKNLLVDEVNIIFHVGATVNFNETLTKAIFTNARSTRDLVHLAQQMANLQAMMYISTAYSNCTQDVIEERIYPPVFDCNKLISLAENLPESVVDVMKIRLLAGFPNTYVFTKNIAEAIVLQDGYDLPIGIQRPGIVLSTYKEPIKGWINNMYGPTGLVVSTNLGFLRVFPGPINNNSNIVPVDMSVNSLIASAWDVAVSFQKAKNQGKTYELEVYNYESNNDKPIKWKHFYAKTTEYCLEYPSIKAIWFITVYICHHKTIFVFLNFLFHTVPAGIFDVALLCTGKSPKMIKITRNQNKICDALSYFITKKFTFKSGNVRRLINRMSDKDKQIFSFDLKEIDWEEFLRNYTNGIRLYLLNESAESLPDAKKKFRRLYWAHQTTKLLLGIVLLGLIWLLTQHFFTASIEKLMGNYHL